MKKAIIRHTLELILGGLLFFGGCYDSQRNKPQNELKAPVKITYKEYFFDKNKNLFCNIDRNFAELHMNGDERVCYNTISYAFATCKDPQTKEQLFNEMARRLYEEYKEMQKEDIRRQTK